METAPVAKLTDLLKAADVCRDEMLAFNPASSIPRFLDSLTPEDRTLLAQGYGELVECGAEQSVVDWCHSVEPKAANFALAQRVWRFLLVCDCLFMAKVAPFDRHRIGLALVGRKPDWTNLPDEFHSLIPAAERFGQSSRELEIMQAFKNATDDDMATLHDAERFLDVEENWIQVNEWLATWKSVSLSERTEARAIDNLIAVIGYAAMTRDQESDE